MSAAQNIVHEAIVTETATAKDLARSYDGLTMAISPIEAKRRLEELKAFVQSVMVTDSDYGTIPGTNKPTLYQQGAQKLAEVYGFSHRFEITASKDWDRGFFEFDVRCLLISRRDGALVGEGVGSANSHESKYRWRWVFEEDLPEGTDKSKLQKQARPKWVFDNEIPAGMDRKKLKSQERISKKKGTKYMVYDVGGTAYRVPNPDVADVVNTLQKMACKRAYVHAVIGATRSSDLFTQDVEDLPPEAFGQAEDKRSWEKDEAKDAPSNEGAKGEATTGKVDSAGGKVDKPPAAKDPRKPPPEKPPTDDQTAAMKAAHDQLTACANGADFARAVRGISEGLRTKKLHPAHRDDLFAYAKKRQEAIKANDQVPKGREYAQEEADAPPPDDYQGATDNPDVGP